MLISQSGLKLCGPCLKVKAVEAASEKKNGRYSEFAYLAF